MTDSNKRNLVDFGKVVSFGLPAFAAIIALMGIYNSCGIASFYGVVGTFNFAVEVVLFVKLFKKLWPKNEEKKEDETLKKAE